MKGEVASVADDGRGKCFFIASSIGEQTPQSAPSSLTASLSGGPKRKTTERPDRSIVVGPLFLC